MLLPDAGNLPQKRLPGRGHLASPLSGRILWHGTGDSGANRPGSDPEPWGHAAAPGTRPGEGPHGASPARVPPRRAGTGPPGSDGSKRSGRSALSQPGVPLPKDGLQGGGGPVSFPRPPHPTLSPPYAGGRDPGE